MYSVEAQAQLASFPSRGLWRFRASGEPQTQTSLQVRFKFTCSSIKRSRNWSNGIATFRLAGPIGGLNEARRLAKRIFQRIAFAKDTFEFKLVSF